MAPVSYGNSFGILSLDQGNFVAYRSAKVLPRFPARIQGIEGASGWPTLAGEQLDEFSSDVVQHLAGAVARAISEAESSIDAETVELATLAFEPPGECGV